MIDWIKLIGELDRMALLGWLTVCLFLISPAYAGQNDHHVIRKSRLVDYSTSGTAEALAHVLIGKAYQDGLQAPQNYAEAARRYRLAASRGLALGQYYLGLLYLSGLGVTQSNTEAVAWFHRASEQGDTDAQVMLGTLYYNGRGVTRDYRKARHWFRRAAAQGKAHAQYSLGMMYTVGHA